jgi:DNA-directed RNA polymerase beta subunit
LAPKKSPQVKPHVDSFNFCVEEGLALAVANLSPQVSIQINFASADIFQWPLVLPTAFHQKHTLALLFQQEMDPKPDKAFPAVKFWIEDAKIGYNQKVDDTVSSRTFPSECRQSGASYEGPLTIEFCWQVRLVVNLFDVCLLTSLAVSLF